MFWFDEPLSNLDAKLRVEMRRELKQLHQRLGATMVYVTHDPVEALTLAERIAVMNEGKVHQVGPPMGIYDWPANRFVAGCIGTPAMNFIDGEVQFGPAPAFRRGAWTVSLADRPLVARAVKAGKATLGVRPDDVRISAAPAEAGLAAEVQLVDMLGDATVTTLKFQTPKQSDRKTYQPHTDDPLYVVCKSEPRTDLRPGQRVTAQVNSRRLHLFDPDSGENRVRPPGGD